MPSFKKLILTIILFLPISGWGQSLDTLLKKFAGYRESILTEKIYIHTDRDTYIIGEKIWFKAYVTDGAFHRPLNFSRVAYIEIIDSKNVAVLQSKISVIDGFGDGSLILPLDLSSGTYTLRAYTNWMKNFSAEYFYRQKIVIINPFKKTEVALVDSSRRIDVQFLPEGGNLVGGITTKIGFQGLNSQGQGVDFKGFLISDNQDTVVTFSPLVAGIGSFNFLPEFDTKYKAVITQKNGEVSSHEFPLVQKNGYALTVSDDGSFVKINVNRASNDMVNTPIYLFIHARNIVTAATLKLLSNNSASFLVPQKALPDGISHITIFDSDLNPVCERLYFKQPEDTLSITTRLNKETFYTRDYVTVSLIPKVNNKSIAGNFSISVFLNDSLYHSSKSIHTFLMLISDLQGVIEKPEYYLGSSPQVREARDNLMLTHGWRRFVWEELLHTKKVLSFIPETGGHIVQGLVEDQTGDALANHSVYLSTTGTPSCSHLYSATSNANGTLLFDVHNLTGITPLTFNQDISADSIITLTILSPFSSEHSFHDVFKFILNSSHKKSIQRRSVAMQVENVFRKMRGPENSKPDSVAFYGAADEVYLLDDYTRFPVMEEVMREYVQGVLVRKKKDDFQITVTNRGGKDSFTDTPLILLNGLPLFSPNDVMNLDPLKVKKIEVVTRRYSYGNVSYAGIVSLTTFDNYFEEVQLSTKSIKLDYDGLQARRLFHSPSYKTTKMYKNSMPDQRTLLYWNPAVVTTGDGEALVEFYTSDISGTFKIIIEGLAKNGMGGTTEITFDVKDK